MNRRRKFLLIGFAMLLLAGCAGKNSTQISPPATKQNAPQSTMPQTMVDAVTSASIVDNTIDFEKAIGPKGTWIIAIIKDLNIPKEVVLEGEFKNGKKDQTGKDIIQRKIALYTQDANRNITARFLLTVPKLTIKSPEASIEHGTLKGDLVVSAKNFKLIDAVVDGSVFFTTEEARSTFTKDDKSKITGATETIK